MTTAPKPSSGISSSGPINVLLVDDRPENLYALEKTLASDRLCCHSASSAREALELLLKFEFAVAILDVQMPEINGFELAELMRGAEKTKQIPIIFVTAGAINSAAAFKGYEAGAVDFLYKPLDARVVRNKVRVFCELEEQRLLIRAQMAELSKAIRSREEFLSIASHELKTPLTSLRLQLQLAGQSLSPNSGFELPPGKLAELLSSSAAQVAKLNALVEDLLDVSRIQTGKLRMDPIDCDLSRLMNDIISRYRESFRLAGSSLEAEIKDGIVIRCDPGRLEQVVENLFSNAIKYAPGSPVRVWLRSRDGRVAFGVRDYGAGIPPERMNVIFEKYERVNEDSGVRGLGLGLYISKQIIEAQGGEIGVTSKPGEGAEFHVELPASAPIASDIELVST